MYVLCGNELLKVPGPAKVLVWRAMLCLRDRECIAPTRIGIFV